MRTFASDGSEIIKGLEEVGNLYVGSTGVLLGMVIFI